MQTQTKKAEQGKEPLVCTYGKCKALQNGECEFCDKHMAQDYQEECENDYKAIEEESNNLHFYFKKKLSSKKYQMVCRLIELELLLEAECNQ